MEYVGTELESFAGATNWKAYWSSFLKDIADRSRVCVEIGSGIGSNAHYLSKYFNSYQGFEPDQKLVTQSLNLKYDFSVGDISSLQKTIDGCIVYIDVLEHIADDRTELELAAGHLSPGSNLFILVPAHNYLFSDFDHAVGHHRRYSKRMLRSAVPPTLSILDMRYLDSIGYIALIARKILRRNGNPSSAQVKLWDRLVPISKLIDFTVRYRIGKSLLVILVRN